MSAPTNVNTDAIDGAIQQAFELINDGRLDAAVSIGNEIIRRHRSDPRGWYLLSVINLRRNQLPAAIECADKAVKLKSDSPHYLIQLAQSCARAGRRNEAMQVVEKTADWAAGEPQLLDTIGAICSHCGEQERALQFFEQAIAAEPDNSNFLFNLATAQRMTGDFVAAEITLDRAIKLNPHDYTAYYIRADLRQQNIEHNHVEELETLLTEGIDDPRGKITILFAAAKECEDIENYERSFTHLEAACTLQRKHMQYDVTADIDTISMIIETYSAEALNTMKEGFNSEEPFFVLGLPRTGTTLVERILGSHSAVYAAGELDNFASELVKAVQVKSNLQNIPKEELVKMALDVDLYELGTAYIESTRPATAHSSRFIDKMPLNYLYCGLIHRALPQAKIIALQRSPMDTCYAVYKAMFTNAYPFSYDLDELGRYYLAFRQLMSHWRRIIGPNFLTVNYEALILNQEDTSRAIIEHCGLEWEDACLNFHQSEYASGTASAVQVRKPVYTSSIGKWKNYERQLQPLVRLLEDNNVEVH